MLRVDRTGIVLVNQLPFERYLLGLDEVPPRWPAEALRAQAVAARTYALFTLRQGRYGAAAVYGFDICATSACQVFSGADPPAEAAGFRWVQAVRSTSHLAVVYGGAPILARYHSTSGGRTLSNPVAFPGEPSYPYLTSVPSRREKASPLYRWHVAFSLPRLQKILAHAGLWNRSWGPLRSVHTSSWSPSEPWPDVFLKAREETIVIGADRLRAAVGAWAPKLYPEDYPSAAATPSGRLPETFPSARVHIETAHGVVGVTGRGWGHGVGMSQWGARGMAQAGFGYRDILRHYYRGAKIEKAWEPRRVSVGIGWALRRVRVSGPFRLSGATPRAGKGRGDYLFTAGKGGALLMRAVPHSEAAPSPRRPSQRHSFGRVPLLAPLVLVALVSALVLALRRARSSGCAPGSAADASRPPVG
jgi:stage II sporulation protein D